MVLRKLTVPFILMLALSISSCSSLKKKSKGGGADDPNLSAQDTGIAFEVNGDSDSGRAGALKTVYFPYDSSRVTSSAKSVLKSNADFLKRNGGTEVQIEGHCDERGGVQYNLALGERRAKAVRKYLVAHGVDSSRISTISFGKERPIEFGHDESSWGKNRRGNFVVTAK